MGFGGQLTPGEQIEDPPGSKGGLEYSSNLIFLRLKASDFVELDMPLIKRES